MWGMVLFCMAVMAVCLTMELLETLAIREKIRRAAAIRQAYWTARHDFSTMKRETTRKGP